eukprot:TRINITY_DN138_c0_g1_i1.p2 TRINITY_DN138_c0_g1~~TRINITY_DN138_c0_g1_i1.p2  ORF type:complete len:107 (+),score=65.45 TRINITY_DN138_c0_g1_i1:73-393(+)
MGRLDVVNQFMTLRSAQKNDEVLALCADAFELDHFKDGKVSGKAAYADYLKTHEPPNGTAEAPVEKDGGIVEVKGTVRKMMMNWAYTIEFKFADGDELVHGVRVFR